MDSNGDEEVEDFREIGEDEEEYDGAGQQNYYTHPDHESQHQENF